MIEFENVARTLSSVSVLAQIRKAAQSSDTEDYTQAQDAVDSPTGHPFSGYSSAATRVGEMIAMIQAAFAEAEAIRERIGPVVGIAEELSTGTMTEEDRTGKVLELEGHVDRINNQVKQAEFKGKRLFGPDGEEISISLGNGSTMTVDAEDFSLSLTTDDLTTAAGIDAFWESVRSRFEIIQDYMDSLNVHTKELEDTGEIIQVQAEGEMGINTRGLDKRDAAFLATQAAEGIHVLSCLEDRLDAETAAAMLGES